MSTAREYEGGSCLAAVGMMLYAGIRPHEVERLRWEDVHPSPVAKAPYAEAGPSPVAKARCAEAGGVIYISPQHSKTGGARHVTIQPALYALLLSKQAPPEARICPPNWRKRWAGLHRAAGWHPCSAPWQPDVLRHTFATHHLATHRNYAELQLEMGHRSAELLRTRYVAMRPACCAPAC